MRQGGARRQTRGLGAKRQGVQAGVCVRKGLMWCYSGATKGIWCDSRGACQMMRVMSGDACQRMHAKGCDSECVNYGVRGGGGGDSGCVSKGVCTRRRGGSLSQGRECMSWGALRGYCGARSQGV